MLRLVSLKSVLRKTTDETGTALRSCNFFVGNRSPAIRFSRRGGSACSCIPHVLVFLVDVGGGAARACQLGPVAEDLDGKQCRQGSSGRSNRLQSRNLEDGRGLDHRTPLFCDWRLSVVQTSMFFSLANRRGGWAKPENGEVLFEVLRHP